MAIVSSSAAIKRPRNSVIAYAIALVRSKPPEYTNREYLKAIAQHFAKGRRADALSATYHHLDRSSWWRSEYERQKQTTTAAEDEVVELKLEVDRLKAKLETANPTKKRKKVDEDVVPVPRSPKKSKLNESSSKKNNSSEIAIAEFDFDSIGEVGNILMRSFYQVNAILKSNQKTDAAVLAYECVRAAAAIPQVLQQVLQPPDSTLSAGIDDLKLVLTACSRAIKSLIMASDRLGNVADGARVRGRVTYAYVTMYAKLSDVLAQVSKHEAVKIDSGLASSEAVHDKSTSKSKMKQTAKSATIKNNSTLGLIAIFLCSVMDSLNPNLEGHQCLFEGFTFAILEKLGSCLYILTFGHRRGETLESEIAVANKADDIEDDVVLKPEEVTVKSAKLEAPYLIQLLNHIMTAAPAHLGTMMNTKTSKAKVSNVSSSMEGALAVEAKSKLQRTLVNCVFGTEEVDESSPLMDCLKKPAISDASMPIPKIKEAEVQAWFTEEVWRLLGWEVLSKEGE